MLHIFSAGKGLILILKLIQNRKKKGFHPFLEEEIIGYETCSLLSQTEPVNNNQQR